MRADYSKVHRLMRLLTLMQSGEADNAIALAQTLGVTKRTIYRDLEILTELGILCYFDEQAEGYHVRRDFFLPAMQFTVGEALADTHWNPSQQVEDHGDGSITFTCQVEGLDEIVWWVLGYGPHAQVRKPTELAERVAELVKATAERYARQ